MVDIAIVVAVGLGVARGLFTGLVRQVIALAGFVLALVLALELMPFLGGKVAVWLGMGETVARIAAFLAVFLIIQVFFFLLSRLVEAAAGALHLSMLNRIGGGVAGAVKAVLLVSIALVLMARLDVPDEEGRRRSVLYGPTTLLVPSMWDLAAHVWPRIQTMSTRFGSEVRSYWSDEE